MYRNATTTRFRRPRKQVVAIIGKCRSHTGQFRIVVSACVTGVTTATALWQGGESSWSSSASTSGWTRSVPASTTHLLRFACRLPAPLCLHGGAHARHLACTKAGVTPGGRASSAANACGIFGVTEAAGDEALLQGIAALTAFNAVGRLRPALVPAASSKPMAQCGRLGGVWRDITGRARPPGPRRPLVQHVRGIEALADEPIPLLRCLRKQPPPRLRHRKGFPG